MKPVLRIPAYRRLLAAYMLNELAFMVGSVALALLVYGRTGSALGAAAFFLVSQFVPGFHVTGAAAALIAALVIGFVNATLGALLKLITLPLTILTLGIFWFVINGLMLELAAAVVPGFRVDTFASAFWGGIILSLVNMLLRWLAGTSRKQD